MKKRRYEDLSPSERRIQDNPKFGVALARYLIDVGQIPDPKMSDKDLEKEFKAVIDERDK
ncbi:MAG: hypothetical protein A2408_00410 [Candidatus Yonathbacteria bacterium RIFOXYC1_FULL_52_10]|uniref:Uncharacterized protein n=1 Tax=Candidatus Yonathbacteria bacterium RIFOXYD1_FULL_52_36 TaxID=1802730 RepID=A0A1G2SMF1_9BACT|nr:MAG: hypothetical protein A2408_00410 [Candidatus Yonathbacteria bacterium RIFOXYC1_FULL_52_10]OHA86273.1 MAG: hypothetical protein A2591_01780 [Candidatus Yonathbacteria bacterium RIFOXYD1_FULL_52_36]